MNLFRKRPLRAMATALLLVPVIAQADFALPAAQTATLENGVKVYLLPQTEVPLVHVRVLADAGARRDGTQAGLAQLTSDALLLGSKQYDKSSIEKLFESRGASINTGASVESAAVSATLMKSDLDTLLPVIADVVLHPQMPESEFNKLRDRRLSELKQMRQSPRNVIDQYFNQLVIGKSAEIAPVAGLQTSVSTLNQAQALTFHRQYWRPDTAAVIVVGDFEPKAMTTALRNAFGNWKAAGDKPVPVAANNAGAPQEARVWLIDKPDAIETTFRIGGIGVPEGHPDQFKLDVINTILGGRFTSWLNDELRVNSGLTYGARSNFDRMRSSGTFGIGSFTKTATTEQALDLALKTYARLWEKGIDAETLASAKAYMKGQFPPRYETNAQLANAIAMQHVYGLKPDWVNSFNAAVDSLSVDEANALAKKYFPRDKLQMVLIGKAETIGKLAEKYGKVSTGKLTDDRYDVPAAN